MSRNKAMFCLAMAFVIYTHTKARETETGRVMSDILSGWLKMYNNDFDIDTLNTFSKRIYDL